MFLEDRDEFFPGDEPVGVRVNIVEHLRQSLSFLLGDSPEHQVALDERDEVVSPLNHTNGT